MHQPLPDISGLSSVSDATWQELAERLRAAGFAVQYLRDLWPHGFRIYERLQSAVRLWRVRQRRDAATTAYRIFILRDPVTTAEAEELLGSHLSARLLDAGLLVKPTSATVVSPFDCRFFMGHWVLCDDLSHQGEAVFGAGPGTDAFTGLSRERLGVPRALDVGCGAGGAAMWLATHAERVVASDINPRALAFVRINCALNAVHNLETRQGDLFATVEGEQFELIISQPPFVPAPPGARLARYRNGGRAGDELVWEVFGQMPQHLSDHGRGVIVFERAVFGDVEMNEEQARRRRLPDLRAMILAGAETDADEYSIRHASQDLRRGITAFDQAVTEMREHLAQMNIRGIQPAVGVVARSGVAGGWIETIEAGDGLWNEMGEGTLDRLFDGSTVLHEPTTRLPGPPRLPHAATVLRRSTADGNDDIVYLALPPGHLFSAVQFTLSEWECLEAWQQGRGGEVPTELVAKMARFGLLESRAERRHPL